MKSLYVRESLFAWQIRELQRESVSSGSLSSLIGAKRLDLPAAVLSFDDGSRSVFRHGLPVLAEYGFRAIQFIVADAIGGTNHWDTRDHGEAEDPLMDAAEIREWLAAGHEIGAHTLTHPRLTEIPLQQAREEIFASKKKLEDIFGRRIEHFCYPYGCWSRPLRDLVEEAGYKSAVTLDFGVERTVKDPFALRRIGARHPSRSFRNVARLVTAGFPVRFFFQ